MNFVFWLVFCIDGFEFIVGYGVENSFCYNIVC